MMKLVQHRGADPGILRLIQKWLKAGVMEEGQWLETEVGTPQGSGISPLLANIYLHYVFDLWVEMWRKKYAYGEVLVVRYADDSVLGFEFRSEADRFLEQFRERLGKFGLELHPEKTRRIEFGRWAEKNRKTQTHASLASSTFLPLVTEIGAVCASERSYGSVRGSGEIPHPYRAPSLMTRAWEGIFRWLSTNCSINPLESVEGPRQLASKMHGAKAPSPG